MMSDMNATVIQARISGTCLSGISVVNSNGTVGCVVAGSSEAVYAP